MNSKNAGPNLPTPTPRDLQPLRPQVHRLLCCVLLLLTVSVPSAPASAQGGGSKPAELVTGSTKTVKTSGGRYALVIGIDDYSQAGFSSLRYSEKGAREMQARLVESGGFPPANVRLLLNAQATKEAILDYLDLLASQAAFPDADTFVLYFSGHGGVFDSRHAGQNSTGRRDNFVIPYNGTNRANHAEWKNIALDEILLRLDHSIFSRRVVFLDACRNLQQTGGSMGGGGAGFANFSKYAHAIGLKLLCGTSEGQLSWEDDELRNGVFTHYLLRGLAEGDSDNDGVVTFNEIDDYVARQMAAWSREHPDKAQAPIPSGAGNGSIALTRAATLGTAPSTPPKRSVRDYVPPDHWAFNALAYAEEADIMDAERFFAERPVADHETEAAAQRLYKAGILNSFDLASSELVWNRSQRSAVAAVSPGGGIASYDDLPPNHWAYGAVDYLTERGVMEGFPDGLFKGDRIADRYEFAQQLARLLDSISVDVPGTEANVHHCRDLCLIFSLRSWTRFELAGVFSRLVKAGEGAESA